MIENKDTYRNFTVKIQYPIFYSVPFNKNNFQWLKICTSLFQAKPWHERYYIECILYGEQINLDMETLMIHNTLKIYVVLPLKLGLNSNLGN